MPLHFELVSPEQLLLSGEAEMVSLPGSEGDMGILPGHAPLITSLRPGVIEVEGMADAAGGIFIAGGFAEVAGDRLTVLAEEAMPVADLNRADLEQRIKDAQEDVEDAKDDDTRRRAQQRIDNLRNMLSAVG
ncbi:MAG: F0F1 ATP synthase subunit epsilon [Alphaproteobacteria bacterium]